jgi:cell division protein FtsB
MVFPNKIQISLKIDNYDRIDFEYLYNENAKFQDLLEYISSFYSNLNICSCYAFRFKSNNQYKRYDNYDEININNTIYSIFRFNKKVDLLLFKKKTYCTCDELIKKYMRQSKKIIINDLNFENEKLKRKITEKETEINLLNDDKKEFEKQIKKLIKDKDSQNDEIDNLNNKIIMKENEINNFKKKIMKMKFYIKIKYKS